MKKTLTTVALLMVTLTASRAQEVEFGLMGGFSIYSGDLSASEFGLYFEEINPAYGGMVRFIVSDLISVRLNANLGRLSGNDAVRGELAKGFNFRTNFTEITLTGELNFVRAKLSSGTVLSPYLLAGVGLFRINPEGNQDGEWIPLQPLGTEGQGLDGYPKTYGLTHINLPIGLGIKFIFNEKVTIGLELTGRKLFTDYLDDVSDTQVNYRDVLEGNGPIAASFSNPLIDPSNDDLDISYQRGGHFFDWYYVGGITLSYRFSDSGGGRTRSRETGCYRF